MENVQFTKDAKIRIILKNNREMYEGNFIGKTNNSIDIINVVNQDQQLVGMYTFYFQEIDKIQIKNTENPTNSINCKPNEETSHQVNDLTLSEVDTFQEIATNADIIEPGSNNFDKAINILSKATLLGLVCLGVNDAEYKIKLLVLSTRYYTFIFDTINCSQESFPKDLIDIIESERIVKVVHGQELASKSLEFYGISLRNIYDTQKWDGIIFKRSTKTEVPVLRPLSECLTCVLKTPESVLFRAEKTNKFIEKWAERPLSDTRRLSAALLCVFLIPLQNVIEMTFCSKIHESTKSVYSYFIKMGAMDYSRATYKNQCDSNIWDLIKKPL